MLSSVPVLALAVLAPLASAFSNTQPVLAWSSHRSPVLDGLSSARPSPSRAADVYASILNHDDVCDFDAVVLVDHPGLHASDLRTLSPSSPLASLLRDAPSSVQFPYVRRSESEEVGSVHAYADALVQRCGARLTSVDLGTSDPVLEQGAKHVVLAYVPALEGAASERKDAMQADATAFAALASALPNHLILFAGSPLPFSSLSRRTPSPSPALRQQPPSTPLPSGGILKRYQLLTPALITSLLLTFFVLLPAVLFGVSALASIQSPLRVEAPKGFSAHEKKTQ